LYGIDVLISDGADRIVLAICINFGRNKTVDGAARPLAGVTGGPIWLIAHGLI